MQNGNGETLVQNAEEFQDSKKCGAINQAGPSQVQGPERWRRQHSPEAGPVCYPGLSLDIGDL